MKNLQGNKKINKFPGDRDRLVATCSVRLLFYSVDDFFFVVVNGSGSYHKIALLNSTTEAHCFGVQLKTTVHF